MVEIPETLNRTFTMFQDVTDLPECQFHSAISLIKTVNTKNKTLPKVFLNYLSFKDHLKLILCVYFISKLIFYYYFFFFLMIFID